AFSSAVASSISRRTNSRAESATRRAASEILAAIREAGGGLLRELEVFDEYRNPETIGKGKRSLAFRLAFGSLEGTLTDEDVAPVSASIVDALSSRFDAVLRA
ncbi:MAG TPA: hypothetical protein VE220_02835, partial [Gaiellaceae bacterium]|nr:hypothetical protein [Gaiellaceae bacterium]